MEQGQQPERWARLWAAVRPHDVEPGELGEYVAVLLSRGPSEAQRSFPSVAAHLRERCRRCEADLGEIQALLRQDERAHRSAPATPPLDVRAPAMPVRRGPGAWRFGVVVAAAGAMVMSAGMLVSLPGISMATQALSATLGLASLVMLLLVTNAWALRAGNLVAVGAGSTQTRTRRGFLLGIALAWLFGTAAVYALPFSPAEPIVVVAEPLLRPWVNDVIGRDPGLQAMGWRLLVPEEARNHPPGAQIWLGLDRGPELQGRQVVPLARSTYVVAVWEASLDLLGLRSQTPVDWLAIQAAVADPNGPRFVVPLPGTPLGDDGLLLLALAHQSPNAVALRTDPAQNPALHEWLAPFYRRQSRLRSDERIQVEDWWRYRSGLGDAGLLAEHDALELITRLPTQARLHIRYPSVDLTRTYVLAAPAQREAAQAFERLRAALLSAEAQRALWASGFRPVANGGAPQDGPFVTHRSRGANREVRWAEAVRTEAFEAWARVWRP